MTEETKNGQLTVVAKSGYKDKDGKTVNKSHKVNFKHDFGVDANFDFAKATDAEAIAFLNGLVKQYGVKPVAFRAFSKIVTDRRDAVRNAVVALWNKEQRDMTDQEAQAVSDSFKLSSGDRVRIPDEDKALRRAVKAAQTAAKAAGLTEEQILQKRLEEIRKAKQAQG